jgi:hypothetical protein
MVVVCGHVGLIIANPTKYALPFEGEVGEGENATSA